MKIVCKVWKHKEFIELLIDNGASLEMAAANLDFLYENCMDTSHLKRFLFLALLQNRNSFINTFDILNETFIFRYIKFHMSVFYHTSERASLTERSINKLINSLIGKSE